MNKDGARSLPHEDPSESWSECDDCNWHSPWYLTAKQARSAARYHAVSTGHQSAAMIRRNIYFVKETDEPNT